MIVEAKCIAQSFESKGARQYFPGFTYPLDLGNPDQRKLADLKTPTGKFVFQFDRAAANSAEDGLFFCKECGGRFDALNAIGTHMRQDHKKTGWAPPELDPESEVEEVEEEEPKDPLTNSAGDRRGLVTIHCKGCGEPFPHVQALVKHKPDCTGKEPKVITQEATEEVAQAPPA